MEWLYYYFIFATSGSIVTWLQIYRPAIQLVHKIDVEHAMCKHSWLGSLIWIGMASIFMPLLILPLLNEEVKVSFIYNLTQGFLKDHEGCDKS